MIVPMLECHAAGRQASEVAVAALSLPDGSDGLLHWRDSAAATTPLQLSTRYFSEPLKLDGETVQFHQEPVAGDTPPKDAPKPLLSLKIPADMKKGYIVLWAETGENQQTSWKSRIFSASDWKAGSMKVINACDEPIGISAGQKPIRLAAGRAFDFQGAEWRDPFPVKIVRLEPEPRMVFSSTWRVASDRRELCIVGNINGSVSLRSLTELAAPAPSP